MKIMINKKNIMLTLFYILMLFSYFQFDSLNYLYTSLLPIYKMFHYISFFIIVLLFLKNKTMSKIIIYVLIYLFILFISSIINGQQFSQILNYMMMVMSFCLITDYGIKNNTKEYLYAISIFLNFMVIINFITILLYPNGMYINSTLYKQNWIFGYKNAHILYLLPCVAVNAIRSLKYKGHLDYKFYLIFFISFLSIVIVNSSTGIVGLSIILIYLVFKKLLDKVNLVNSYSSMGLYLLSFISIMILKIQNLFKFLIVDILKKDLTFTGRTYIWDSVLKSIKSHALLGYGNVTFQYNKYIFTTHNTILDILYKTGIAGFTLYFFIIFETCKALYACKQNKISKFLSIILLSYFVIMLTEAYTINYYFFILVICCNIKYLRRSEDDE